MMDMRQFGGTPIFKGGIPVSADPAAADGWNFGWLPNDSDGFVIDRDGVGPDERTAVQAMLSQSAVDMMPTFAISGRLAFSGEKAFLWEFNKKARNGKHNPHIRQITGCCVGAGLGSCWMTLAAVERIRLGQAEKAIIPFWLLPYGRSRFYLGQRSQGEGSTGATAAKAAREDGVLDAEDSDLPKWTENDGYVWGRETELKWSDGSKISESFLTRSRQHLIKSTAQCRSADDVRDALTNGYPLTCASNWGGLMECPAQGEPAVRLNRRSGTWMHQMSIHGYWNHPTLGEIFYILNQWGLRVHGDPLNDEPPGGFWIKKTDMEAICKQNEVFAFSQFDGFPANDIFSWLA